MAGIGRTALCETRRREGPGPHRALLANIDQASQANPAPVCRSDVVLGVWPLFHAYGLNAAAPGVDVTARVRLARVRLLSKPGCHLCDDARGVVEAVCTETGTTYDEVDITTDPGLTATYAEQIPVTFVDGVQHDYWRVDPARLRAALL